MSRQFPEHYCSVSERLSHILDNVGYSREDRFRKVTIVNETEVFFNMATTIQGFHKFYSFGSRSEGSTGPDLQSDTDRMFQINIMKVVNDISQCPPELNNMLMVHDDHTHPGYVKLQLIGLSQDNAPVPVYYESNIDDLTTIDSLYRTVLTNTLHHNIATVSGPACHYQNNLPELSTDVVYAYRCSQWPQEGYEWFMRRRLHGWPTPIQIDNAREYGCFVTPVGHPHSSERHLEWRLSFSIAERELTRSFEDTTMKVYNLLKMIRKTYIEPVIGDAFSSYHCKVCMFWMRERIQHELWINRNLLYCLVLCIRQLYEWATTGFCPDYFIITNNIYDRKIFGTVRNNLLKILRSLLSSDCTFLLGIKCCNVGLHLAFERITFDYCILPIRVEETFYYIAKLNAASICKYHILQYIPQNYSTLVDYLDRFMHASKNLPCIMQYPLKHAMMIMWSHLGFHIATICKEKAYIMSQGQVDYLVAVSSVCLSFGIKSDSTSVRLKLCGLGMELGNHNLVQISLGHISDYYMRYIFSETVNGGAMLNCNVALYTEWLLRYRCNTEELLQTKTSFSVIYLPTEMSITPKPLRMEMFRSVGAPSELREKHADTWFDWSIVDSLMCLYFFMYLNFSRQGKVRHKDVVMYNIIHVIKTEPIILHRDTAFNLLGYSFMQENQLANAYRCFNLSLKIRPYHNAAKFYLGIIFNRIHATEREH